MIRGLVAFAVVALCVTVVPDRARSQDVGVDSERILFGQSAALTGPVGQAGREIRLGILAAFREANLRGGVHGRRLELISLDDLYEPANAAENTQQLIGEHGVFALIGAVGTPTSRSAVPIAEEAGVPYIAPFTGASLLRVPDLRVVVNLRASYYQETEEIVAHLLEGLGIRRIAVLYQDDSFGLAGLAGAERGLARRGLTTVAQGSFIRNTTAVKAAMYEISRGDPEAVILVGPYRPIAKAVYWARKIDLKADFATISFGGGNALIAELGDLAEGVYVTQVVPYTESSEPIAASYRRALAALDPQAVPGFVSLEGYMAGRLAIEGLERCEGLITRRGFLQAILEGDPIDLDGFVLRFGEGDNQGSDRVVSTVIGADGRYRPVVGWQSEQHE